MRKHSVCVCTHVHTYALRRSAMWNTEESVLTQARVWLVGLNEGR